MMVQGRQLLQKQFAKGETTPYQPMQPRPSFAPGRPDAFAIAIGGQTVPRLAVAEGVMKDVPIDAASLRARTPAPAANSGRN